MTAQLFSGLVELDNSMQVRPLAASKWEVSDSGKTYTFHLRQDIYFHPFQDRWAAKERKLTAQDFKYSFTRIVDPKVASAGAWIFNEKVEGVKEFQDGGAPSVSGFEALDDSTFQIRLRESFPPFIRILTMPYCFAVPKEAVEFYGTDFRTNPIGTGPFVFKSWSDGVSLVLHKNEYYFESENGKRLPFLDAIEVKFITSELSAFVEFTQGRLDFINGLDDSFRDEILDRDGQISEKYQNDYKVLRVPQLNTEFLGILVDSTKKVAAGNPLFNRNVREALSLAIDREKLVKVVLRNAFYAAEGFVPNGIPGFEPGDRGTMEFDREKAAQLLQEAGFPGGKGMPKISLKNNPKYQKVMEFVQRSWQQIGVECEIDNMQGAALRELASKGEINMWRASWIADYPDAENYMGLMYTGFIPPNGANRMRYSDAVVDSFYVASFGAHEDEERGELFRRMEAVAMKDYPVIPLYFDVIFRIVQPGIEGMETNAMNHLFLKRVKKRNEKNQSDR